MERYAGHAVPVLVAETSLQKRASRLKNRPMRLREEGSSIVVNATKEGELVPQTTVDTGRDFDIESDTAAEESEDVSDAIETIPDDIDTIARSAEKKAKNVKGKARAKDTDKALLQRFVPLKDILPDLPKRGSFDVNEIKVRFYFYSLS